MADVNVLDLSEVTPGSGDNLILFDRTTGAATSTRFDTLKSAVTSDVAATASQHTSDIQTLTNNVSANATAIAKCETLVVSVASFSALPQTITNANIEDDMVVVNSVLSNPSAQTGDWTVTTSSGSLTISGSISGTTTATLYLMKSR